MKGRYLALATAIVVSGSASAQPPNVSFEFVVITDTLEPLMCSTREPPPDSCEMTEGPVPYKLATLNLTHEALTTHRAQWYRDWQGQDTIDDGHVISLVMSSPNYGPDVPFKPVWLNAWTFDLKVRGNHISGDIDVEDVTGIGGAGCFLYMKGSNNNWAGTWRCGSPKNLNDMLHSFNAIVTRVTPNVGSGK
jgi:hypothetical protein